MKLLFLIIFCLSLEANVNVVCKAGIMDDESAKKYITKFLQKEPKNIECILKLASVYLKSGDILKGYRQIVKAYNINPKAVKTSKFNTILDSALESIALEKRAKQFEDKDLWNLFADSFFEMGAYKDATYGYRRSLKIDSNQPEIALKLSLSYQKSNQIYKAVSTLREVLRMEEDNFYATYYLAKILRYDLRDEIESHELFSRAKTILEVKQDEFNKEDYISLELILKNELE